jgi:glycerol uptake facilitator-like aquaporin
MPVSGFSINPARTIGPAVTAGLYEEVPLYVAAQLVGAIFGSGAVPLVLGAASGPMRLRHRPSKPGAE